MRKHSSVLQRKLYMYTPKSYCEFVSFKRRNSAGVMHALIQYIELNSAPPVDTVPDESSSSSSSEQGVDRVRYPPQRKVAGDAHKQPAVPTIQHPPAQQIVARRRVSVDIFLT